MSLIRTGHSVPPAPVVGVRAERRFERRMPRCCCFGLDNGGYVPCAIHRPEEPLPTTMPVVVTDHDGALDE